MSNARWVAEWVDALQPLFAPALAAAALLWLARSGLAKSLIQRVRRVSGLGVEFEFSVEGAAATRQAVEESLSDIRRQLRRELEAVARSERVPERRQRVMREFVLPTVKENSGDERHDLRSTIHVPDPLFADNLYQLLDYYPGKSGAGRSYSRRVGIIGEVWRSETTKCEAMTVESEDELVHRWGMTYEEADRSSATGRQSFAAILLSHGGSPVAILYMDALYENAFGATQPERDQFAAAVAARCDDVGLSAALGALIPAVIAKSPRLDFSRVDEA